MPTNDQIVLNQLIAENPPGPAGDQDPDEAFELFVANLVLKDFDLSDDAIASGVVDGEDDGGMDAIYLFVNGELIDEANEEVSLRKDIRLELVVIQASTHVGFRETVLNSLILTSRELFDLSLDTASVEGAYNEGVLDATAQFRRVYRRVTTRFPSLEIKYYYASPASAPGDKVERKAVELQSVVKEHFSDAECTVDFLGARDLVSLAQRRPERSYSLQVAENPISSGQGVGFVCLVNLRQFFEFIADSQGGLQVQFFEANVRDYQGSTEVNGDIRQALTQSTGEDFWWLNNGVSIIASDAFYGGKAITIQDPEIVNGLQTSREIYDYLKSEGESGDDRTVLVRVIVPVDDGSRDRIIKATNWQNPMPKASLRATEAIHHDIEVHFRSRGLFYDRRKGYYRNQGERVRDIVSISYVGQAVMSIVLRRPDTARARPSSLLKHEGDYNAVFSPTYPIGLFYVCTEAVRRVERWFRTPESSVGRKDWTNLRFYVALHAMSQVVNVRDPGQVARMDVGDLTSEVIGESADAVMWEYLELGGTDKVAKGPGLRNVVVELIDGEGAGA